VAATAAAVTRLFFAGREGVLVLLKIVMTIVVWFWRLVAGKTNRPAGVIGGYISTQQYAIAMSGMVNRSA
jgi:hypothetical protein